MAALPAVEDYPLPTEHDLPPDHVGWKLDPDRALLLVHDMQQYFLHVLPTGLRGALIENVAALRGWALESGVAVLHTAQPGRMTPGDRGLLRDFWGEGMRMDAADRTIPDPVAPVDADSVLTKWRYSAFFRSDLRERMRTAGRDQIVLCGVYAGIGLQATALEAFTYDLQVFFVADAVADFGAEDHHDALRYVARRCGRVVTTSEVTT